MKILLALDGSPSSIEARDLVAGLSWPTGTVVRLLSAYHTPGATFGAEAAIAWFDGAEETLLRDLDGQLESLAEPFTGRGWTVERRLVGNRPASAIVDDAAELGADLIVLGARGRGALPRLLLGSVSTEVIDHAPCPVLIARAGRVSRLLVATDGSDAARGIAARVGGWGAFAGLRADVIAVAPARDATYELLVGLYTLGSYPLGTERAELLEQCRRIADELARDLAAEGLTTASHVEVGDAADEIIAAAGRLGADLIVAGSRGLSRIDHLLLGSVARKVASHASASVLLIHAGGPAPALDRRQGSDPASANNGAPATLR